MAKKQVVFGQLSPQFDYGTDDARWERMRPTVDLCMSEQIKIDCFQVAYLEGQDLIIRQIKQDIESLNKGIEVVLQELPLSEHITTSNDFEGYYVSALQYYANIAYDYDNCDYYIFIPPGKGATHIIAMTLVITYLNIKCRFIHKKVTFQSSKNPSSEYTIYDVDLPAWFASIGRYAQSQLPPAQFLKSNIRTQNAAFNTIIKRLEHVALNSEEPILLSGETGVGKTFMAQKIYDLKKSCGLVSGKYVEVNCGTLKGDGLFSQLFGHAKGAYTGAVTARDGLLKSAHNGVIFLDEISEMPLAEQVVLLKALEEKAFSPFGSEEVIRSNFRVICGTNKDLHKEAQEGRFRHDLLERLAIWHFILPPLRERLEDIEANIQFELQKYTLETAKPLSFAPGALEQYLRFATSPEAVWKGNMRALAASIRRMATFAEMGLIHKDGVYEELHFLQKAWSHERSAPFHLLSQLLSAEKLQELDLFDKIHLEGTISVCLSCQTKSEAGRKLFACTRNTKAKQDDTTRLYNYLKNYELTWDTLKKAYK